MNKDQWMYNNEMNKDKEMYNNDTNRKMYNDDMNKDKEMYNKNKDQRINQQQAMLRDIQQCQFTVLDLALFLDTHPNDPVALYRHKQYSVYLRKLTQAYEALYGPTCDYSVETSETWRYINGPWPWEQSAKKEMSRDDRWKRGN
jgi:spore coat protein JB